MRGPKEVLTAFGAKQGSRLLRSYWGITGAQDLIPARQNFAPGNMGPYVSDQNAMRHSAVWACLRLRADLISTLPLDVYRSAIIDPASGASQEIECPKPPFFYSPSGDLCEWEEWSYSSQMELDRTGNSIGIIREVNGAGKPARIDLQETRTVVIQGKGQQIMEYRIGNEKFKPEEIWHEKQFTVSGCPVGLSPVAHAAYTLGEYMSVQQFVTSWFMGGATPRARLKNVERKIDPVEAVITKEAWRASQTMGEPFVHGADWEYSLVQAEHASTDWVDAKKYSATDIARFFGCPGDLIDAAVQGQSVTYANITQRNLQFLIMNLGPAITRREKRWSNGLLAKPRYVKLNTDALLRMDPQQRAALMRLRIESRQLAPSEARANENLPPFTDAQIAEFDHFWPPQTAKQQIPVPMRSE